MLAPLAVSDAELPLQIVVGEVVALIVGLLFTTIETEAVFVQPFASIPNKV